MNGVHDLSHRICLKKMSNILLFIRTVVIELLGDLLKKKFTKLDTFKKNNI